MRNLNVISSFNLGLVQYGIMGTGSLCRIFICMQGTDLTGRDTGNTMDSLGKIIPGTYSFITEMINSRNHSLPLWQRLRQSAPSEMPASQDLWRNFPCAHRLSRDGKLRFLTAMGLLLYLGRFGGLLWERPLYTVCWRLVRRLRGACPLHLRQSRL